MSKDYILSIDQGTTSSRAVLFNHKGEIVENGTHEELLSKENGFYKNLYDSQFAISQS